MERKHCKHHRKNKSKPCIHKKIKAISQQLDYIKFKIQQLPKVGPQGPVGTIGQQGLRGFQGPQGFSGPTVRPPMSLPPFRIIGNQGFQAPNNTIGMTITGIGGGGGGGPGGLGCQSDAGGGGGSSGELKTVTIMGIVSGTNFNAIIGEGGAGGLIGTCGPDVIIPTDGENGGDTFITNLSTNSEIFRARGGIGGMQGFFPNGGGSPFVAYGGGAGAGAPFPSPSLGGTGLIANGTNSIECIRIPPPSDGPPIDTFDCSNQKGGDGGGSLGPGTGGKGGRFNGGGGGGGDGGGKGGDGGGVDGTGVQGSNGLINTGSGGGGGGGGVGLSGTGSNGGNGGKGLANITWIQS